MVVPNKNQFWICITHSWSVYQSVQCIQQSVLTYIYAHTLLLLSGVVLQFDAANFEMDKATTHKCCMKHKSLDGHRWHCRNQRDRKNQQGWTGIRTGLTNHFELAIFKVSSFGKPAHLLSRRVFVSMEWWLVCISGSGLGDQEPRQTRFGSNNKQSLHHGDNSWTQSLVTRDPKIPRAFSRWFALTLILQIDNLDRECTHSFGDWTTQQESMANFLAETWLPKGYLAWINGRCLQM